MSFLEDELAPSLTVTFFFVEAGFISNATVMFVFIRFRSCTIGDFILLDFFFSYDSRRFRIKP